MNLNVVQQEGNDPGFAMAKIARECFFQGQYAKTSSPKTYVGHSNSKFGTKLTLLLSRLNTQKIVVRNPG